jgi:hypothetical protein
MMNSTDSITNKSYVVEFPELPGVLFTVTEQPESNRRDGIMLAELLHKVAAEIWFNRSAEDKQRVIDENRRMAEMADWTMQYVLMMLERGTAQQSNELPTIAVSGSENEVENGKR